VRVGHGADADPLIASMIASTANTFASSLAFVGSVSLEVNAGSAVAGASLVANAGVEFAGASLAANAGADFAGVSLAANAAADFASLAANAGAAFASLAASAGPDFTSLAGEDCAGTGFTSSTASSDARTCAAQLAAELSRGRGRR